MKTTVTKAFILWLMGFILMKIPVYADEVNLDYPHCSTYDIACLSCHYMFEDLYTLGWPDWVTHEPADIDECAGGLFRKVGSLRHRCPAGA